MHVVGLPEGSGARVPIAAAEDRRSVPCGCLRRANGVRCRTAVIALLRDDDAAVEPGCAQVRQVLRKARRETRLRCAEPLVCLADRQKQEEKQPRRGRREAPRSEPAQSTRNAIGKPRRPDARRCARKWALGWTRDRPIRRSTLEVRSAPALQSNSERAAIYEAEGSAICQPLSDKTS